MAAHSGYYKERINRSLAFITEHLSEPIKIADLADTAHFSTFHFQRLFKAMQGESPYDYILRLRLEKSIFHLKHYKTMSVTDVAFACGFESLENFSRQFKAKFGFAPSQLKHHEQMKNSRIHQEAFVPAPYLGEENVLDDDFDIILEQRPKETVAFIRCIFGADGAGLLEGYNELLAWYKERYQSDAFPQRFGMSVDDPDVTPANKYRYDFAVRVPEAILPEGKIGAAEIPAGLYASVRVIGDIRNVAKAWDFLYKHWLPKSEFVPRHYPAIEEFVQGPESIGWETYDMWARIPLERI
jgi:DNA gyrase inhibitor GyrI/AraC-like DNA-binding protein